MGALLASCSSGDAGELAGEGVNLYGTAQRTSDYSERVDQFRVGFFISHLLEPLDYRVREGEGIVQPPVTDRRKAVYLVRADGSIVKVVDEKIEWRHQFPERIAVPLVLDANGNVYGITAAGEVFSLSPEGTLRWKHLFADPQTAGWYGTPLIVGKLLLVHSYWGQLVAFSLAGQKRWERHFPPGLLPVLAADRQGRIYGAVTHRRYGGNDTLFCLDTAGQVQWKMPLANTRLLKMVAVRQNMVYAAGVRKEAGKRSPMLLLCAARNGAVLDTLSLSVVPHGFAVGRDTTVVVVGYNSNVGKIYSLVTAFRGKQRLWQRHIEGKIDTPPLLAAENIAIVLHFDIHAAVLLLDRQTGNIEEYASLDELPLLNLFPVVAESGNLLLAVREKDGWIEVGEPAIYRFLPY